MNKRIFAISTLVILAVIVAACGPTATPTATPPPPPTSSVPPALTAALPTATSPAPTPMTVPPTDTPAPVSPTLPPAPIQTEPPATRIQFASGATSALVAGNVAADGIARYVLRAGVGQVLEIDLAAPPGAVRMQVWGADGDVLMSGAVAASGYRGVLRSTQDYYIAVIGNEAAPFSLFVRIPERIMFAPGGTSAVLEGSLVPGDSHAYVLNAAEGQWMDVTLSAPAGTARLVIYSLDGIVLVSGMGEETMFRDILPITQDYIIVVHAGATISYGLNVTIPERISFSAGAVSATRTGSLSAGGSHDYVLGARAGQTMEVHVSAPAGTARLVIWGADGTVLRSGMGEGADFIGTLPATQDYFVRVGANQAIQYTIEVRITG
jgi:hypothetical protein